MKKGTFIMGDLNVLGWVVYRGVDCVPKLADSLDVIPDSRWKSIALDKNRKYCVIEKNLDSKQMKNLFSSFNNIIDDSFDIFMEKVDPTLCRYEMHSCSVFKNTKCSEGQPDHCNYPRAHDKSNTTESSANKN